MLQKKGKKIVGVVLLAVLLCASCSSLVIGIDVYEIHITTDQEYYYPGEHVLVSIRLLKNGEGIQGGVCPEIYDPEDNMVYGGLCYGTDQYGYFNITNFWVGDMLGTYTITVHGTIGEWEGIENKTFKVVSETVTAEANGPYEGGVGQPVQFYADASGGKPSYTWYWEFGDGDTSYERNATHIYEDEGTFIANLTVTDQGDHSDTDFALVIIQDLQYHLTVQTHKPFYFTSEKVLILGRLTQGDTPVPGVIIITVTDPGQTVVFQHTVNTDRQGYYDDTFILKPDAPAGEYTVLVEEEKYGVANATTFDVFSSVITADAHGPYQGTVGHPIQFSGDATGGLTPYSWYWNFDDDTNATQQNPTHAYQSPGIYTVTLTVNDNYHHNGTDTAVVTISEPPQGNHTVLIEEGTATWCSNCPSVAEILHTLYASGDYNFYYVAMIEDKNTTAHNRLYDDYNIYGFPTVFIDGGYQVVLKEQAQSVFEDAIQNATARETPALEINLTTQWNQDTQTLETTVRIYNPGTTPYAGHLRVYLTEINSRWSDYDGNTYHYGFLDYLLNEDISITAGDTITRSNTTTDDNLDPANLMIIAAVFNAIQHQGYANPPTGNPFNAYYVDATVAIRVSEGNLPPQVGITNPKSGKFSLFGKPIRTTPNLKTILLGRANITAQASDDSSVTKVEFYIDDKKVAEFTTAPYEWMWKTPTWLKWKHTIKVVAYDDQGKSSTTSMDVSALILF